MSEDVVGNGPPSPQGGGGRAAPAGATHETGPEPSIEITTLANGLRVITERMPEATSVSVGFYVGVGSRDEPEALSGASHFLEHLLFKGTAERSAFDISISLDAVEIVLQRPLFAGRHCRVGFLRQRRQVGIMLPQRRARRPHIHRKPPRLTPLQIPHRRREHHDVPRRLPVGQDELSHDRVPLGSAAVPVVFVADRRVHRPRGSRA